MAAAALVLLASCGESSPVSVPDVIGMDARGAYSRIEAVDGLSASFDHPPIDPAPRCAVEGQDQTGEVDPGTPVVLEIACRAKVPDVTGFKPKDAIGEIESVFSLEARVESTAEGPADCTVRRQDPRGGTAVYTSTVVKVFARC